MRNYRESFISRLVTPTLILMVCAGIFGMVWVSAEIISIEYSIGEMESEMDSALKERQQMEAELSSLMSIQQVSQRGLNLGFPDRQRVFYVFRQEEAELGQTASLTDGRAGGLVKH